MATDSDETILSRIRARHLIELDTIDLDFDLARAIHDRSDIEAIVSDAETLLRKVESEVNARSAVFGIQNLPSPPASPLRIWKSILMEAPLKSPRTLAAILLRARKVAGVHLPKLYTVLDKLVNEPPQMLT